MKDAERITIIGTGLLGGSIGLGLRAAGFDGRIIGVGRRDSTINHAIELNCIDEGTTCIADGVANSDMILLATPIGVFESLLGELAECDLKNATITDVGSTKAQVCETAARLLDGKAPFVGSHPMAGSEQHGPEHAQADLFRDATCIVTPTDDTNTDALSRVESLWASLGMRVLSMTPTEHDQVAARVSHLPHAVAVLLMQLADRLGGLDIAATGLRDTTRVASGDARVWLDIFSSNRTAVVNSIDNFTEELAELRRLLTDNDDTKLSQLLTHAKTVRDGWVEQFDKRKA